MTTALYTPILFYHFVNGDHNGLTDSPMHPSGDGSLIAKLSYRLPDELWIFFGTMEELNLYPMTKTESGLWVLSQEIIEGHLSVFIELEDNPNSDSLPFLYRMKWELFNREEVLQ